MVKLKHKDKNVKYRFFAVPGDGTPLLGMPDIKLLSILRLTCDVIGELYESRRSDLHTIEMSNSPSCRTNGAPQTETDSLGMCDDILNMSDCFRSSAK